MPLRKAPLYKLEILRKRLLVRQLKTQSVVCTINSNATKLFVKITVVLSLKVMMWYTIIFYIWISLQFRQSSFWKSNKSSFLKETFCALLGIDLLYTYEKYRTHLRMLKKFNDFWREYVLHKSSKSGAQYKISRRKCIQRLTHEHIVKSLFLVKHLIEIKTKKQS